MRKYSTKITAILLVALTNLVFFSSAAKSERHVRIRGTSYPLTLKAKNKIEPIIQLLSPLSGAKLTSQPSPFYNASTEEIAVAGIFTALDELMLKRKTLRIFVNDESTPALVKFSKKVIRFGGKNYLSGTFAKALPVTRDIRWPMRPVTAEVVNINNNKVLARDRASYYDLRFSNDADTSASLNTEIIGFTTQISSRGIGDVSDPNSLAGLEIAYLSSLPQPGLNQFNSDFTQQVQSIPTYDNNSNILEACIDYADLSEDNFSRELQFGPFAEAMAWAKADHLAYEIADDACESLPNPAAILACKGVAFAGFCVHNDPDKDKFELCVDQIEGDVDEGTISTVNDASLKFLNANNGNRAQIESDITLGGVNARVYGRLRNLFVRWKNPACVSRPRFTFNDSEISGKPWLDSWTSCPNLQINITAATTMADGGTPGRYDVKENPEQTEQLRGTLEQSGNFVAISPVVNPDSGNCGLSFMALHASDMLSSLVSDITQKLSDTWYSGLVSATEARALTKLFSPYRLGGYDLPGHDLDISLVSIGSAIPAGLIAFWDTKVNSTQATVLANQRQQFFYQPPGLTSLSVDAKDHLGNNFDVFFNLTTGLINKILNVRAASANLHFEFKPTWQELANLGVTVPVGANPDDTATLNEATMKEFHQAFSKMGNTPLEIFVEPVFDPMVFMTTDPTVGTTIPDVGSPLAYGFENLSVTFKTKDKTRRGKTVKGKVLLRTHISFVSKGFNFTIDNAISNIYLRPHLDQSEWTGSVVTSKLQGCAMYAHYPGVGQNCERSLESKVTELVRNRIESSIENFVSRIPSPKLFNVLGDAANPVEFLTQSIRQENQNITFYGQYRRP